MFTKDPEKSAARKAKREAKAVRQTEIKEWRKAHSAEPTMNGAASLHFWPTSEMGVTKCGHPMAGAAAELFTEGARTGWTATRLVAGAATLGASAVATGRKAKGAAVINVSFMDGHADSFTVKTTPQDLRAANRYVTAFNALSRQLQEGAGA